MEKQTEALEEFRDTIEKSQKKEKLLYTNYLQIEKLLNVILTDRTRDYGWKEIAKILGKAKKEGIDEAQIYESLDPLGKIGIKIEVINIGLDCKKSINANAEVYYEKAKREKRKIKGAE